MTKITYTILTAVLVVILWSCERRRTTEAKSTSMDWQAIAEKILEQSDLQSGEKVLLMGSPGAFDSLVTLLGNSISREGADYLGTISVDTASWPESWKTDFVQSAEGKSKSELTILFGNVDLGIMLPGAGPNHTPYAALQDVLKLGKGRTIHFHWIGAYDFSGKPMTIDNSVSQLYQKVLLGTYYQKLTAIQQDFETAVRRDGLIVTTPAGTNIKFSIGDRPVTKQNGDASLAHMKQARNLIDREVELPAGAIRVAPIEETVEGMIAFPDATWNDQKVEGLILSFKKGKVVGIKAKVGAEAVKAELDKAGEAGYSFREIAVGFNPMLASPQEKPWIPYYGYGAGVVRLSLGDNSELGGKVTGEYVRWNFFTDATVSSGNDIWIRDGKLVK